MKLKFKGVDGSRQPKKLKIKKGSFRKVGSMTEDGKSIGPIKAKKIMFSKGGPIRPLKIIQKPE